MIVFFARDGGEHEDGDYYDFYLDKRNNITNLRIAQATEQHQEIEPSFMEE